MYDHCNVLGNWILLASGDQAVAVSRVLHFRCVISVWYFRDMSGFHILAFIVRLFWILFHLPECFRVIHSICTPLFPGGNSFSRAFVSEILPEQTPCAL